MKQPLHYCAKDDYHYAVKQKGDKPEDCNNCGKCEKEKT